MLQSMGLRRVRHDLVTEQQLKSAEQEAPGVTENTRIAHPRVF